MNLNKDLSEYEHLVNSSGKVVVFMKLAELVSQHWWVEGNILNTSVDSNCDCPRTWVRLTKQIQETVIAVFEDYFHRNNWLPQSISVANDAVCILKLKNHLPEMIEFLNAIMENFLHVEWSYDHSIAINGCESDDHSQSEWEEEEGGLDEFLEEHTLVYRIDSQDDIYAIDELPTDEIQQSVNAAMEIFLQQNHTWIESELTSLWRIESRLQSPRLPPELWELVIDNIDDADYHVRQQTLANCSLTCHEFYRCSHKYLYTGVMFTKHGSIKSFLKCLSRAPNLRRLTTCIDLHDIKACSELFLHGQPLLPNLQSVELTAIRSPLHPALISNRRPFYSVTKLKLGSCIFGSVLDLRRLIQNFFPEVIHLTFYDISIDSSHISLPPNIIKKPPSLSGLVFTCSAPVIIRWLLWTLTPNTLKSLSTHATDLPKMLPLFGRHLQFLNIQWDNELDENSDLSLGDDVLPVLQILQINLFGLPPLRQLCDILLTSKFASSLLFIQIPQPPPPTNSESSEEDFHVLDDALGQLPDCVRIEISQEYWEHLPKSKSRGVFKA